MFYVLRKLAKQEEVELDALSEWVKSVKHHLKRRIYMVSRSGNTKPKSTSANPILSRYLKDLHDQFVIVPADKSGLTLHDFRRTMDQIGCDMSRRVVVEDRGK